MTGDAETARNSANGHQHHAGGVALGSEGGGERGGGPLVKSRESSSTPPPPSSCTAADDLGSGQGGASKRSAQAKRTVCDHCRRRRIRCDGKFPCEQCLTAALQCKRDHVPKKRGPKRGHGRVINELRAKDTSVPGTPTPATSGDAPPPQQPLPQAPGPNDNPTEYVKRRLSAACPPLNFDSLPSGKVDFPGASSSSSANPSAASSPSNFWANFTSNPFHNVAEPRSVFSSDEYRPRSRDYRHMIPQCVELYYEHIYPIMPLIYMPAIRETIARPMTHSEKNLVYALCALTSMHMSGKSIEARGPSSWELVGRFFLDETISVRQGYDFLEDLSLSTVISSFYLSTSFFEINQSRKSWHYLREAVNNAQDLGLQNDATYYGLTPEETLCRQRVFWILFVTERSFAILRNKPITFKRTPSLPATRHPYESPDIHAGFLQLVSSYTPLDESFVTAWNEGSDPRVSATTFLALQNLLALTPAFLKTGKDRRSTSPPTGTKASSTSFFAPSSAETNPEPTDIQKADLLITQQWLRLIVWQSSMRQNLLSWANPDDPSSAEHDETQDDAAAAAAAAAPGSFANLPDTAATSSTNGASSSAGQGAAPNSMCFSFPLIVARDTASILASLPPKAVEVHGMGIMEKIFEIGSWCVNVLGACESVGFSSSAVGMAFTAGDLGIGGGNGAAGRRGSSLVDPIEFFVRTLSASPNSRSQFAEKLLKAAAENPGSMRLALSPPVGHLGGGGGGGGALGWGSSQASAGTVLGEVVDQRQQQDGPRPDETKMSSGSMDMDFSCAAPAMTGLNNGFGIDMDPGAGLMASLPVAESGDGPFVAMPEWSGWSSETAVRGGVPGYGAVGGDAEQQGQGQQRYPDGVIGVW